MKTKIIAVLTAIFIRRQLAAILVAALAAPSVALAEEPETGLYAGAGPVYIVLADDYLCASGSGLTNTSCENDNFGFKAFAGYRFSDILGVEVSYVQANGFWFVHEGTSSRQNVFVGGELDYSSFYFAGVGRYPLNERLDLVGKIGLQSWKLEGGGGAAGGGGIARVNLEDDGNDLGLSVGAQFKALDSVMVAADWDYNSGAEGIHHWGVSAAAVF